jgi:uncharacterized protein YlaN (UPF0358 family)
MAQVLDLDRFKEAVKLLALYQVTLEQMDAFRNTKLYKQSIKNKMNSLEKEIESLIRVPVVQLDNTDFDIFQEIQVKVDAILDLTIDELTQLRIVVEDTREADPFGDHFEINPNSAEVNEDAYQNGTR